MSLNNLTPKYLKTQFKFRKNSNEFRDAENKLYIPRPRTNYMKQSFAYGGVFKVRKR